LHLSAHDHRKGLLLAAIGGMTLTVDIPLIRLADGGPWSILMLRTGTTLVATVVIWAVWRSLSANTPRLIPGRAGLIVAALYGLGSLAFIAAVFNTSTADLVFILAFNTAFAAILSWIFLKERPPVPTLVTIAVMILGVLIIVGDSIGHGALFGNMAAMASALSVAAAITVSRSSREDMGFTSLIGVLFPFVIAVAMVGKTGYHIDAPWWIVFNGAVVMPISFFCLAAGPRYLSGGEVAMFYLLETVLAPIWVWAIFAEVPSRNSLIGGAVLIVALVAHSLWQLFARRRPPEDDAVHYPAE
jgi:drug/metabolite transporter (DMT)-like permease